MRSMRERELTREGYRAIAGVDEAGRGAWAGPLVAAAVILPLEIKLPGLADSKALTPDARERLYVTITRTAHAWAVGIVPAALIDARGITWATYRAMELSLKRLAAAPDYVLVDAYTLPIPIPHEGIIHGDSHVRSIAAASVIAKVTRDALMEAEDKRFPAYAFAQHKGYGTAQHYEYIQRFGLTPIHRRSYADLTARDESAGR